MTEESIGEYKCYLTLQRSDLISFSYAEYSQASSTEIVNSMAPVQSRKRLPCPLQ